MNLLVFIAAVLVGASSGNVGVTVYHHVSRTVHAARRPSPAPALAGLPGAGQTP